MNESEKLERLEELVGEIEQVVGSLESKTVAKNFAEDLEGFAYGLMEGLE